MVDYDKAALTAAFKMMRKYGILARQNFLCCQTCGCAEVDNIVSEKRKQKRPVPLGYCFYHAQDAERLRHDGKVHLAYGAIDNNGDSTAVGNIIAHCLSCSGLLIKWDGSCYTRIEVDCVRSEVCA